MSERTTTFEDAKSLVEKQYGAVGSQSLPKSSAIGGDYWRKRPVEGAAARKALKEGVTQMEEAIAESRWIAWLSLTAAIVTATCAIWLD